MKNTNNNESDELLFDVLCIATTKVVERIEYSIAHPTWFDKSLDKIFHYIFNSIDKFSIIVLRLLKDELEKS